MTGKIENVGWWHWLALEESDVDDGRVEVDELEDEHFEDELVFELRLSPVHLCSAAQKWPFHHGQYHKLTTLG